MGALAVLALAASACLAGGKDACVTVDFSRPAGRIRALNGGNLGPQFSNSRRLADGAAAEFGQLGVSSVRLHDVPLFNAGQRLVDTHFIFGNFACDPASSANYYFKATDDYIRLLRASGSEPFYRLGISIEHTAGTYNAEPPADYAKWAEICCGIIRHYNRGWADGHRWNIRYWEIWNEADIGPAMWNGAFAEYCRLYEVVSKRIKEEFPEVKVGGPASVWFSEKPDPRSAGRDAHAFLAWCRDHRCPLDFYSWHHYTKDLKAIVDQPAAVRRVLDGYGYPETELVLDEWHYGSGSDNCATDATAADETAGINAAVFCPAVLTLWQDTPITMGHHYTIGPSAWGNGRAWGAWRVTDGTSEPRFKLFYALRMFAGMLRHADRVTASSDTPDVTVLAGRDAQGRRAVLVCNLKSGVKSVRVRLAGAEGARFCHIRTDAAHHETRDEVTADGDGLIVLSGEAEGLSACDYLYEPDDAAVEREGIVTLKSGTSAVVSDHPERRFEKSWPLERPVSNGTVRVTADIRVPMRWGRKSASHWKGYPLRESALRIGLDGRLGEAGPTYVGNGTVRSIALEAGEDEGVPIAEARPLGDCTRGAWYRYVLEFDLDRGTYSVSAVRRDGTDAPGSVRDIRFAAPLPPGQVVSRVVASAQGILSGIGDSFVADDAGGFENVRAEWRAPDEGSLRAARRPVSVQLDLRQMAGKPLDGYLEEVRRTGAESVQLVLCEFFAEGEARQRLLEQLKEAIAFFERAGYPVWVWTSTLGYGDEGDDARIKFTTDRGLTRLTGFDGRRTCGALCAADPKTVACLQENIRDFARSGAKTVLLDDEMVQARRENMSCLCPRHLSLISKKAGRPVTGADVKAALAGAPNDVRTAYFDAMGETLENFVRALRAAADEVNPDLRLGLCGSFNSYDTEGTDEGRLLRILAGRGRPLLRLSGATYWIKCAWGTHYDGQEMGGVAEFLRLQLSWFDRNEVTVMDENDPYPRDSKVIGPQLVELYDTLSIAAGIPVRNKYILRESPAADPAYLQAHCAAAAEHRRLEFLFADSRAVGWRVFKPQHYVRAAHLAPAFPGPRQFLFEATHPRAGIFLTLAGETTAYEADEGPVAVFGDEAAALPSEFRRAVLTDEKGLAALRRSGLQAAELPRRRGAFRLFGDGAGAKVAVVDWAEDYSRRADHPLFASSAFRADLAEVHSFLSGKEPEVAVFGAHEVYAYAARDRTGALKVLLANVTDRPTEPFTVRIGGRDRTVEAIPAWGWKTLVEAKGE